MNHEKNKYLEELNKVVEENKKNKKSSREFELKVSEQQKIIEKLKYQLDS